MEPLLKLQTATILLGLAAVGGVVMSIVRLRGAPRPPSSIAMLHGLLAGAALTLLLYAWFTVGLPGLAKAATVILIGAALGGVVLNIQYHSKLQPLPIPLMLAHAALAVGGFVALLLSLRHP